MTVSVSTIWRLADGASLAQLCSRCTGHLAFVWFGSRCETQLRAPSDALDGDKRTASASRTRSEPIAHAVNEGGQIPSFALQKQVQVVSWTLLERDSAGNQPGTPPRHYACHEHTPARAKDKRYERNGDAHYVKRKCAQYKRQCILVTGRKEQREESSRHSRASVHEGTDRPHTVPDDEVSEKVGDGRRSDQQQRKSASCSTAKPIKCRAHIVQHYFEHSSLPHVRFSPVPVSPVCRHRTEQPDNRENNSATDSSRHNPAYQSNVGKRVNFVLAPAFSFPSYCGARPIFHRLLRTYSPHPTKVVERSRGHQAKRA